MNPEGTKITGMIAVFDNAVLNARFDYEINLETNKVAYFISCHWKNTHAYGKCPFKKYEDAAILWSGLPNAAALESGKENAA